jgi:DNA repair exonuclease SbcCD nuclease subunit
MEKVIFIGDLHFKKTNNKETDIIIQETLKILLNFKEKILCVLAGDLLDEHEKIFVGPLNKIIKFIDDIRNICEVIILVGNHDYENNRQFFTENHWMNSLKKWDNVTIVDKAILKYNIVFMPYVPPGMFLQGINTIDSWKKCKCIFAHQEFRGCILGNTKSEIGDPWDINFPTIFSGHIHKPHILQKNIIYPGSVIQHTFGEQTNDVGILCIDLNTLNFEKIRLNISSYRTINMDSKNIYEYIKSINIPDLEHLRINLECELHQIKEIKSSIPELPPNVKIVFKNKFIEKIPENNIQINFLDLLRNNLSEKHIKILDTILFRKSEITFKDLVNNI